MRDRKIEGILLIEYTNEWQEEVSIPLTHYTRSASNINVLGNRVKKREQTTTYTYGGFILRYPRVQFLTRLIDVKEDKTAWISTSTTKGRAYAGFYELISSLAETTMEDLIKSKVSNGRKPFTPVAPHEVFPGY